MRLRWLVICDKNGNKTQPVLQYWDDVLRWWIDVPVVEVKESEAAEAMWIEELD